MKGVQHHWGYEWGYHDMCIFKASLCQESLALGKLECRQAAVWITAQTYKTPGRSMMAFSGVGETEALFAEALSQLFSGLPEISALIACSGKHSWDEVTSDPYLKSPPD